MYILYKIFINIIIIAPLNILNLFFFILLLQRNKRLIAESMKFVVGVLHGFADGGDGGLSDLEQRCLSCVVSIALCLSLVLQRLDSLCILPADLCGQPAEVCGAAAGVETLDLQRVRQHHSLHLVVRWRDAFKDLETLHGVGAAGCLVRDHAADAPPDHPRGSAEMDGAVRRLDVVALVEEGQELGLISIQ